MIMNKQYLITTKFYNRTASVKYKAVVSSHSLL